VSRRRAGPVRRFLRRSRLYRSAETRWRYLHSRGGIWRWVVYGTGGLFVLAVIWLVATGLVARNDASTIRSRLSEVQRLVAAGDVHDAQKVAATIPALAHRAHKLTTGPAWFLASEVPYFGKPLQVVRGTAAATDVLGSQGVTALLSVIGDLDPAKLRVRGDTVNLAPIIEAAPKLKVVDVAIDNALHDLRKVPSSSWFTPIDGVRSSMMTTLSAVGGYVDAATRAAEVLPDLLGNDGPKRYFVGLQNEAEMRGTGGLPGSFAILVANKGTVKFTHFESDVALQPGKTHLIQTGLNFGNAYRQTYAEANPTQRYVNSNISPNFKYAAQIWAAMWEKVSGEHVDGALALDPQVLANLLTATGPVKTAGGGVLTAENVVPLTEQQEYAIFSDNNQRKQFLVDVLKDVSNYTIEGHASANSLVSALSLSSREHRVQFWTSNASAQALIDETNYSGSIPAAPGRPFVGMVVSNNAAGKLDYYLRRSVQYESTGCGSSRDVTVTMQLQNTAPASGLPLYVTTRLDKDHPANVQPGDNREALDYWATPGAQLKSVTVNGVTSTASVYELDGHPIYRLNMELPHGTTSTVILNLLEPKAVGSPIVWQQPGVLPIDTNVQLQAC